jgi:hypothetical protein
MGKVMRLGPASVAASRVTLFAVVTNTVTAEKEKGPAIKANPYASSLISIWCGRGDLNP